MPDIFQESLLEELNHLPYWYLSTQEERINAYLNYHAEQEKKQIEDFIQISDINDIDKVKKSRKI